ncbi:MAG TPA: flagellar motor protein MotB [Terriglobales bacterium]|nr:flagellar motor protein MotB [Terriglobales bacterium]
MVAPTPESKRPIIIIKKKAGHGGHHGGAWKVAYADFVTAMMALFIVLWLMNSSKQLQEAVGGYFKDPTGTSKKVGTNQMGSGENFDLTKKNMEELKEQLQKSIRRQITNFDKLKNQIEMTITSEGLRIELLESSNGTFFETGSPMLSSSGKDLLLTLSTELGKLPNHVSIEGHTDSNPYNGRPEYGNWELSTDRANTARRIMQENGLRADQVTQVRGYADQKLRVPANPLDPSNRRISLIVQYVVKDDDDDDKPKPAAEGEKPAEGTPAEAKPAAESQAAPAEVQPAAAEGQSAKPSPGEPAQPAHSQ